MNSENRSLARGLRVALASVALALAACGGGGGGDAVRADPPPASVPPPVPMPPPPPVVEPANPSFGKHLALTHASAAHAAGFSGAGVRIGVVDSGVNRNHPALQGRVEHNLVYLSSPPNNLRVDDVVGHGTAVAQIMAGRPFGQWPGGIAPGAAIISARIISDAPPKDDGSGQGNEVDGALGLKPIHQDLIDRGARIMNNSWGGLYWTNLAATAPIAEEYRPFVLGNNGLVVFATGNSGFANPSDTAALPSKAGPNGTRPAADLERGWLAVAALDTDAPTQLASYSNACGVAMRYCLVAPGNVVTTGTNDAPTSPSYWNWRGTSFAAPQVSGAAALVWQAFPYFSNDLVRQTLLGGATDLGAPGPDPAFGYGLLNLAWAIRGPTKFDWGDARVQLDSGTSTWSNPISGAGGLVKQGNGTLVLGENNTYTGRTQVLGGELRVEREITSPVTIGPQGTLSGYARFGAVDNGGTLRVDHVARVVGDYRQTADARLALMLGGWLYVEGTAHLAGAVHVIGARTGYVASSYTPFLSAVRLEGRFDGLTSAQGVFLDATLNYGTTDVWLDVRRLDVTAAARSMGLTAASLDGAQRVEGAFDAIDAGRVGGADADGLLTGAGAIQRAPSAAAAERTLASLSGELHGADAAFAMLAIEGHRHALESRVDALRDAGAGGVWSARPEAQRALPGFDLDAAGWMIGQDLRRDGRLVLGGALAGTEGYAHHGTRHDRERNRHVETQLYATYDLGRGYLLGTLAAGRMQRWMQRDVLLGSDAFRIEADYAQRRASAGLQAGLPLDVAHGRITPYAGLQSVRLDRDGFSEQGAFGFGLSAAASSMAVDQALFGVRYAAGTRIGPWRWDVQGRVEWQRLLSQTGGDIDARFTAVDAWSPIRSDAVGREAGVFGLGLGTALRGGRLGFDVDARHDRGRTWSRATLNWTSAW